MKPIDETKRPRLDFGECAECAAATMVYADGVCRRCKGEIGPSPMGYGRHAKPVEPQS